MLSRIFALSFLLVVVSMSVFAQEEAKQGPQKMLSADARLQAATTIYLKNSSKSDIPMQVVQASFEGWPKYMVVDSPEKADLILQVDAAIEAPMTSDDDKKDEKKKDLTITSVRLTALESRNKVVLWSQSDRPTGKGSKEEKTIEATQRLIHAFRKRVEPDSVD